MGDKTVGLLELALSAIVVILSIGGAWIGMNVQLATLDQRVLTNTRDLDSLTSYMVEVEDAGIENSKEVIAMQEGMKAILKDNVQTREVLRDVGGAIREVGKALTGVRVEVSYLKEDIKGIQKTEGVRDDI